VTHEAGQAARSFIDALKDQPLSLALVLMNIGLLGFLYYTGIQAHKERQREMELLYDNRYQMAQLLYQCVPTGAPIPAPKRDQ
jgi:hypothetical protein